MCKGSRKVKHASRMAIFLPLALGLLSATQAEAGQLSGIPLGAWMVEFQTFVIGLGLTFGTVGLLGLVVSKMENSYGHVLAGFPGFFVAAGMFGGVLLILGAIGLVGGATLPY
jgi:hypothetical protein